MQLFYEQKINWDCKSLQKITRYLWNALSKKIYISLNFTKVNKRVTLINNCVLLMSNSEVTTESGGRQNMFPSETKPYIDETLSYDGYPQNAEKVNGRWAMVGFVALVGAYITTGQIIPGIF